MRHRPCCQRKKGSAAQGSLKQKRKQEQARKQKSRSQQNTDKNTINSLTITPTPQNPPPPQASQLRNTPVALSSCDRLPVKNKDKLMAARLIPTESLSFTSSISLCNSVSLPLWSSFPPVSGLRIMFNICPCSFVSFSLVYSGSSISAPRRHRA